METQVATKEPTGEKQTTYQIRQACNNCGMFGTLDIPKGKPVWEFIREHRDHRCPECGCLFFKIL